MRPDVKGHASTGFCIWNTFFFNSVLFLLFSYKTTCTWSNQFCSVQTTKILVLHYQILHIQNIYKAQVKNYSFLLLDHKRCPLTRWSALLWLSKVCEHTWKFKADKKQKRQRLIYQQQRPNLPIPSLRLLPVRTVVVRMKRPSVPLWGFPPSSYLCFPTFDKFMVVVAMGGSYREKTWGRMPPRKTCAGITEEVEDKHIQAVNIPGCLSALLLHMEPHAPLPSKPKTKLSGDHPVHKFGCVQVLFSRHRHIQRLVSQIGLYWGGGEVESHLRKLPSVAIIKRHVTQSEQRLLSVLVCNNIWRD